MPSSPLPVSTAAAGPNQIKSVPGSGDPSDVEQRAPLTPRAVCITGGEERIRSKGGMQGAKGGSEQENASPHQLLTLEPKTTTTIHGRRFGGPPGKFPPRQRIQTGNYNIFFSQLSHFQG